MRRCPRPALEQIPELWRPLYAWLRAQWQASVRDTQAQAIFDELAVEEGGPRRHPLESETFRMLLAEPALLRAA